MEVYVVIKQGIYMQGIYGIFDKPEKAKEALLIALKNEKDDYHEFYIDKRTMNNQGFEETMVFKAEREKEKIIEQVIQPELFG